MMWIIFIGFRDMNDFVNPGICRNDFKFTCRGAAEAIADLPYKKPTFGNQPVLFPIQGCYFQEQPEKFLKSVHKKLFIKYYLFLFISYSVILCSISAVSRHNIGSHLTTFLVQCLP